MGSWIWNRKYLPTLANLGMRFAHITQTLSHCFNFFFFTYYHRNNPKFTSQPAQVTYVPVRPRTLVWRVLHLLREHGGHGHLRLWTHVSVLHLRPQAQEDVQCLLSDLQAANQGHHQDLSEHIRERKASLTATQSQSQGKKCHVSGNVSSGTFL